VRPGRELWLASLEQSILKKERPDALALSRLCAGGGVARDAAVDASLARPLTLLHLDLGHHALDVVLG
jgi:hypothetical protein